MRILLAALLLFTVACGGATVTQEDVVPDVDPNDALADADPSTGLDLEYTVNVLDTGTFGSTLSDPAGITTDSEAQGEWAGVQIEWATTGDAPIQPYAHLIGATLTDGTQSWTVGPVASTLLSADRDTDAPTTDVGPGFTVTFWAAADVPEGTEVSGITVDGVTYEL